MKKSLIPVAVLALAFSGCGQSAADKAASASASATPGASSAGFPSEVQSCDTTLKFDQAPEKVLILGGTGLPNIDALGLSGELDLRAGNKNFGVGQEKLQATYDGIPELPSTELETGGAQVATEVILENEVDLVIGYETGVDREALAKAGVQLYSPAAFCPNYSVEHATWELVDAEINNLASIFGVQDRAVEVIKQRQAAVEALGVAGTEPTDSAVALYVTPGSPNYYAYGSSSMVQPIFEASGVKNSYESNTERVFDASMEDLLSRDPKWIVLLAQDATDEEVLATFKGFPGAEQLTAVAEQRVVVLPFALTDPPSMLSVEGATQLAKKLTGN